MKNRHYLVFLLSINLSWGYNIFEENSPSINDYFDENPPPNIDYPRVARYVVHRSIWTIIKTRSIAGFSKLHGVPFASSTADTKSTENIYFVVTDQNFQNIPDDTYVTLEFPQGILCSHVRLWIIDPRCTSVELSGKVIKVLYN